MFTQSTTSPTPPGPGNLAVSSVSASPALTPPSRSSRLRGLSYLRTHLSREHSSHSTHSAPAPQPATSTPSQSAAANPWFAPAADNSNTRTSRFSQLVPTLAHPLGLPTPPTGGRAQNTGPATTTASGRRSTESAIPVITTTNAAGGTADIPGAAAPLTDDMTRARSATTGDPIARHEGSSGADPLPSIRFSTFYDPRATRPSLKFNPVSRTLPTGKEVIRVGRYSERDNQPNVPVNAPSAAPVGFKSKVVSRRHCEFWYEDGKWYIRDVKSSSGTFLNHIRLSPPGTESKPYPINDGDIVQLGIDFKGGEEMIFRCVKMRLELNRGWQNKLNTFNMATHKRLRNMTAGSDNSPGQSYSQDCSICLNTIAPCQCLFVAPCSHTWHYKCIRSLLSSPSYPIFICPNCRAAADLEAEVEDPEEWEQLDSDELAAPEGALLQAPSGANNPSTSPSAPRRSRESVRSNRAPPEIPDVTMLDCPAEQQQSPAQIDGPPAAPAAVAFAISEPSFSHTTANPMPIPAAQRILCHPDGRRDSARTPSPPGAPVTNGAEGPITPRNDAGPWVFDGSGVRLRADGTVDNGVAGGSLEAAVQAIGREDDIS